MLSGHTVRLKLLELALDRRLGDDPGRNQHDVHAFYDLFVV